MGKSNEDSAVWALKDINLEVHQGETLGIIGPNGAGKSTLLKILAGVTPATRGDVQIRGRVFPMIELNAGLHPELTGRENGYLLGAIMGLSRNEARRKMPQIEEFCELGEWFDRPVRQYSSGMLARLGFGVALNVESDIILIDETFSVGDLKFQNKSLARVRKMRESGVTVLLVTHSLDTVQFVAQRGILLDKGRIVNSGTALEALNAYESLVFRLEQQRLGPPLRHRISSGQITLCRARVYGHGRELLDEVQAGAPFGIEVEFHLHRELHHPVFSIGIVNASGILCIWNVSQEDGLIRSDVSGICRVSAWYPENSLMNGAYEVHFAIRDGSSFETLDRLAGIASFAVVGSSRARGIIAMPCHWQLESYDSK